MGDRVECPVPPSTILSTMMKQKGFHDSHAGDKFLNFILFFPEFYLSVFVDLENFSPETDNIRVNFEVLKLLHLCMDLHEVCFK